MSPRRSPCPSSCPPRRGRAGPRHAGAIQGGERHMAVKEWSDWYAREDPTTWVLAEILTRRAGEHPDRPYLKFADRPWVSYGEINARANRIANALIARGVQRGESVSVMLPNCEEFLPVWYGILKAGAVMSSINTAYKGDFLSWTINLVEAKKLVIADA